MFIQLINTGAKKQVKLDVCPLNTRCHDKRCISFSQLNKEQIHVIRRSSNWLGCTAAGKRKRNLPPERKTSYGRGRPAFSYKSLIILLKYNSTIKLTNITLSIRLRVRWKHCIKYGRCIFYTSKTWALLIKFFGPFSRYRWRIADNPF